MLLWTNYRIGTRASHAERLPALSFNWALRGSIHRITSLACPYTAALARHSTPFVSALEKSVCRRPGSLSTLCPCDHGPARTHPAATSRHYRPPAGRFRSHTTCRSARAGLAVYHVAACSRKAYRRRTLSPSYRTRGKSIVSAHRYPFRSFLLFSRLDHSTFSGIGLAPCLLQTLLQRPLLCSYFLLSHLISHESQV